MKPSILIVIEQIFDPYAGGVQRSTMKLLHLFYDEGHDVGLLCITPQSEISFNIPGEIYIFNNTEALNIQYKRFFESTKMYDVVINQSGYSLPITRHLFKYKKVESRLINTLRINPLNFRNNLKFITADILNRKKLSFLNGPIFWWLVLQYHYVKQRYIFIDILGKVDAYVMLSEKFNTELYELVPKAKHYHDKIYGINNPFEISKFKFEDSEKKNVILYVGRLELHQKRVDLLLAIWKELHSLINWEFWVIGDGDQEQYMKRYCQKHNLNRVTFFGKQNPEKYYREAKLFHFTSAYEGFGNVLVEAQMNGCVPVLFDSYPAASEIINHNIDGVLIRPFNIIEYVKSTVELINDKNKRQELALNAVNNVKRFSFSVTYEKWLTVFNKIE